MPEDTGNYGAAGGVSTFEVEDDVPRAHRLVRRAWRGCNHSTQYSTVSAQASMPSRSPRCRAHFPGAPAGASESQLRQTASERCCGGKVSTHAARHALQSTRYSTRRRSSAASEQEKSARHSIAPGRMNCKDTTNSNHEIIPKWISHPAH